MTFFALTHHHRPLPLSHTALLHFTLSFDTSSSSHSHTNFHRFSNCRRYVASYITCSTLACIAYIFHSVYIHVTVLYEPELHHTHKCECVSLNPVGRYVKTESFVYRPSFQSVSHAEPNRREKGFNENFMNQKERKESGYISLSSW